MRVLPSVFENSNAPRAKSKARGDDVAPNTMVEGYHHWWITDSLHRRNLQGIPTEKQMCKLFHKVIPEPNSRYLVRNKGWNKFVEQIGHLSDRYTCDNH
jgi:hypothetical protein